MSHHRSAALNARLAEIKAEWNLEWAHDPLASDPLACRGQVGMLVVIVFEGGSQLGQYRATVRFAMGSRWSPPKTLFWVDATTPAEATRKAKGMTFDLAMKLTALAAGDEF